MTPASCEHRGHCFHEPDGAVWERHSQRPQETVKGVCCDCGTTAVLPMHSEHVHRSLVGPTRKKHGEHMPKAAP